MRNKPSESNSHNEKRSAYFIPDPWEGDSPVQPKSGYSSRQFPLRPDREISAAPSATEMLSPQSNPMASKLAPVSEFDTTAMLLEEEMKVNATQAQSLWNRVRDAFVLLWWSQWQNTISSFDINGI